MFAECVSILHFYMISDISSKCMFILIQWDPMITTLPGLYMTSLAVLYPIQWLFAIPLRVTCSTLGLRAVNVLISVANVGLLCYILRRNAKVWY